MTASTKQSIRPPPPKLLRVLFEHQRWLSSNGKFGKQLDADELLFDQMDLRGVDFSRAHLSDAHFLRGDLSGANFSGAFLAYSVFMECELKETNFTSAYLCDATFVAKHEDALFKDATLDRVAWNEKDARDRKVRFPKRSYLPLPKLSRG